MASSRLISGPPYGDVAMVGSRGEGAGRRHAVGRSGTSDDLPIGLRVGRPLGAQQQDAGVRGQVEGIPQPAGLGPSGQLGEAGEGRGAGLAGDDAGRGEVAHALEGAPQFSPAMIEWWGPGTVTIRPAWSERSTQAAASGSTPISRGGRPKLRRRQCRTAAAASPPTPTGTMTRSGPSSPHVANWSSTSQKMVP